MLGRLLPVGSGLPHWGRLPSRSRPACTARASNQQMQITDTTAIAQLITGAKTVAVVGIKTEQQANQPAFYVPEYLAQAGLNIIPVPVYYSEVTTILGKQVYRKVSDVPEKIDICCMFRRPSDLMGHLEDILQAPNRPDCVWLQSGITNPEFEEQLAKAGIKVVADKCLMVEHRAACKSSSL